MKIDADPTEWRSDRKREPVFAPGGFQRLIVFALAVAFSYWVSSTLGVAIYRGLGGT